MGVGATVNSKSTCEMACQMVIDLFEKHKWIKVSFTTSKRSLTANALSHVFYKEISKSTGETIHEAHQYCKLQFGVPILRGEAKPNGFFEAIGFDAWDYRKQLASMKYVQVTSLMSVTQMREYLEQMIIHYAGFGIILESKPTDG